MKAKIDIDGLSDAVQEELKNWQEDTCNPVLNEAYKAGAEEGKKVLLQGGPYKERTGKYTKDWDVTQRDRRVGRITGTESYSVHNKKHYQLTHLLQNGHASRNGGRVTKNAWKKTAKKQIPDPPYIVYLVSEDQRGDDNKNTIREIDGSIELYTDRTPDESLEGRIEEEVLSNLPFRKYQTEITSENMVQTAYEFNITQKKGRK